MYLLIFYISKSLTKINIHSAVWQMHGRIDGRMEGQMN